MKSVFSSDFLLGILGGGQLGKMLLADAHRMGIQVRVLDPDAEAVCRHLCAGFVQGRFDDYASVYDFGKNMDVLTIEIEHINVEALIDLEKIGVVVQPAAAVIKLIQNKADQKVFYKDNNLPTAKFEVFDAENLGKLYKKPLPYVWKACTGGYDGKGVKLVRTTDDINSLPKVACVIEELVDFEQEIAVIVAQNANGEVAVYPPVSMAFGSENLVEYVVYPAQIPASIAQKAQAIATELTKKMGVCGVLAVEMFVLKNGEILINEVAPRPHNSGHLTIECMHTSQYEQHLRAVLNLPLGSTQSKCGAAVMVNITGEPSTDNHHNIGKPIYENIEKTLQTQGANLHIYGKKTTKPHRKMAHITIVGNDPNDCMHKAKQLKNTVKVRAKNENNA
jgi:5-(carboxyamino)imidazole ribonucleotide synthase